MFKKKLKLWVGGSKEITVNQNSVLYVSISKNEIGRRKNTLLAEIINFIPDLTTKWFVFSHDNPLKTTDAGDL